MTPPTTPQIKSKGVPVSDAYAETEQLAAHLHTHEAMYREALSMFERQMRENARTREQLAQAGGSGLITEQAAADSAEYLRRRAEQAELVMAQLEELIWGPEED